VVSAEMRRLVAGDLDDDRRHRVASRRSGFGSASSCSSSCGPIVSRSRGPAARVPIHADLCRVCRGRARAPEPRDRALVDRPPRRALPSVSSRRVRPGSLSRSIAWNVAPCLPFC
jgi:hypothetical protein